MWSSYTAVEAGIRESSNVRSRLSLLLRQEDVADQIGYMVFLNDVRLHSGPTPNLFFASGAKRTRMLVVADGPELVLKSETLFDVKGTIQAVPSAWVLRKVWKLSKEEAEKVRDQGVYIRAEQLTVSSRVDPARAPASGFQL